MSSHKSRNPKSASTSFAAPLSAHGRLRRYALLSGMGLSVLAPMVITGAAHAGAPVGTPAWFAQRNSAAPAAGGANPGTPSGNIPGAVTTPQQAQIQAQRSIQDLNRAMTAISNMRAAQTAAHNAAQQISVDNSVPDGLATGGLVPDSGLKAPGVANTVTTWTNAGTPTQSSSNGKTDVTVVQSAQYAILNWNSFNVGKNTTLDFDQSKGTQANGNNSWVALNRVNASASPAQILGTIKADGSVYLINQNGIVFGGSSQVNVHSLLASTLNLYSTDSTASNSQFLSQGLLGVASDQILVSGATPSGNIEIEKGASINSGVAGGAGGYTLIAAPDISNAGSITSTDGQIILAAGTAVTLTNGAATAASTPGFLKPVVENSTRNNVTGIATIGDLNNTGLIEATRGQVMLAGSSVEQDGVLAVTTSVSRPGSMIIDALLRNTGGDQSTNVEGILSFGKNSLTAVLPQEDGETTTSSNTATAQFQPGSAIFTAGSITFQNGALMEAPGATVSVIAATDLGGRVITTAADSKVVPGRVYVDDGATIDVSGLANIELPVADTLLTIGPLTANDLSDSPLNAGGLLYGSSITIDTTLSGTRSDGKSWIGSPLVDASNYVENMPRTIDQLLVNGGTLKLAGKEVITASGSVLNLDGGYVHYLGGMVNTTKLVGANGQIYDVSEADPNIVYVGFSGVDSLDHPRWNVTESFVNPVLSGASGRYEPDFIQGGHAGTLDIYASSTVILDGTLSAKALAGRNQVTSGMPPPGGIFEIGNDSSLAALVYPPVNIPPPNTVNYIIEEQIPALSSLLPGFTADTALNSAEMQAKSPGDTSNLLYWSPISATSIAQAGFSNVTIGTTFGQIIVDHGANLTVQPGGTVNLSGARLTVFGDITARSGSIALTSTGQTDNLPGSTANAPLTGDILVYGKLDASGEWVNDSGLLADQQTGDAYINGGSIALTTRPGQTVSTGIDTTGSILLAPGSTLDVSSGGYVQADGSLKMSNGLAAGKGGDIALETYAPNLLSPVQQFGGQNGVPAKQPIGGQIDMDGSLLGYGFAGGGTLTLKVLDFQIGGDPAAAPAYATWLPADFFTQHGFGNYVLQGEYDATIASGTTLKLSQQNLIPVDYSGLLHAATGSDVRGAGLATVSMLDAYYRPATDLSLTSGYYLTEWRAATGSNATPPSAYIGVSGTTLLDQGASIVGDAGAKITLGSVNQVTVLGSITAHGGSITLTGDDTVNGLAPVTQSTATTGINNPGRSVWLGADATLDASGTALIQPVIEPAQPGDLVALGSGGWVYLGTPPKPETVVNASGTGSSVRFPTTGKVLDGGSVTLTADTGYVIAQKGAVIDVSGSSASLDLPQTTHTAAGDALVYAPATVSSDAGQITLSTGGGLYFDATLKAAPGGPDGEGGTLTIRPFSSSSVLTGTSFYGATGLIIRQSGAAVPAGLQPGQVFETASDGTLASMPSGTLYFSADELKGSGISTLVVGSDTAGGRSTLVPIAFAGNVKLELGTAFEANASQYIALAAGSTSIPTLAAGVTKTGGATVEIDAPYVSLSGNYTQAGSSGFNSVAAAGDATLNVNANFIDIGGVFGLDHFGNANFNSSGDIRFLTPAQYAYANAASTPAPGVLYSAGNLSFKAGQLYPASANTFIIDANGEGVVDANGKPLPLSTTVSILPYAGASTAVPLSAGGTLLIDATNIVQDGTIRAPAGSIVLGVGDSTDPATKASFNNLPLVATQQVTLGKNSLTSVSLGNATIPYGVTVDGVQWQYPGNPSLPTPPDLTAPPAKLISINGAGVTLQNGANVDLSGGGTLQATEWVPGSGGTRDVLSQSGISYASSNAGTQVPLYPDDRGVYAIIPSGPYYSASGPVSGTVAAYDAVIQQGQASIGPGQSVYLSAVAGLPAGWYTLLPAKYATLPGAYRIVQDTGTVDTLASNNAVLADGTYQVAGYYGNDLSGSRASRNTSFEVQSAAVWGQYSEYTKADANSFFAALAAGKGSITPQLPQDAGHLILGASSSLSLAPEVKFDTAPAPGSQGAAAQIDIASQDIQIAGSAESGSAPAGYVLLDAATLGKLGAGSLLIGGTRQDSSSGVTITALADNIVVATGQSDPLQGPEIILVTKADGNAADGIHVGSGSVIQSSGSLPASADKPIVVTGGGALLRVSNAAATPLTRTGVTTGSGGLLEIGSGAVISGGQALTLDSTGNVLMDPSAQLSAKSITADSGSISFVAAAGDAAPPGLVIGPETLGQFGSADSVVLRSYGAINFIGDVDVKAAKNLTLSAGTFSGGGSVSVAAGSILTLDNELAVPVTAAPAGASNSGSLALNGAEVVFGAGNASTTGFNSVGVTAQQAIVGSGTGSMDFGAAPVTLSAPVLLADVGSNTTLKTSGALTLNQGSGTAPTATPLGGALTLKGGSIVDNGTIDVAAGKVTLDATSGNLIIAPGATVSVAGVGLQFFDVTAYAPAGAISLIADAGTVQVQSKATLDFSAATGGGDAGSLSISAPKQAAQIDSGSILKGSAATGNQGGSFALDVGGSADLDALTALLTAGGIDDQVSVHTRQGNLNLSAGNTLTAASVLLVADNGKGGGPDTANGNIAIAGTIDASGAAGGTIELYGSSGVDLEGRLLATASAAGQRGGSVVIGTSGTPDLQNGVVVLNPVYGYESVSAANSGSITLGTQALIDVGNSAGGTGGTVELRAPLLNDGNVKVSVASSAQIHGARDVGLEAYAVWSTTDPGSGAQHFDGYVDPAGWYDSQGNLLPGTFTDQSGNTIVYDGQNLSAAQIAQYLSTDYFTPTGLNTNHAGFYGYANGDPAQGAGTLMGFVEQPGFKFGSRFAAIQNFHARPGIELDNPSSTINQGNISVLSNWNLGAGETDSQGNITHLDYRYGDQAPVLTLRAVNNVKVNANISDGFFQKFNPVGGYSSTLAIALADYNGDLVGNQALAPPYAEPPATFGSGDVGQIAQYYGLYQAYYLYLVTPTDALQQIQPAALFANAIAGGTKDFPGEPTAPAAPTDPKDYPAYLTRYAAYFQQIFDIWANDGFNQVPTVTPLAPPPAVLAPVISGPLNNTPSPQPAGGNPLSMITASLAGGNSSSYRIVAGADLASANPLGLQSVAAFANGGGNVTVDGHFTYTDSATSRNLEVPTMIRTGTGSIDIAAGNDFSLTDTVAPGVVYAAGAPAPGTTVGTTGSIVQPSVIGQDGNTKSIAEIIVTGAANPDSAGDVSIHAQRDINGVEQVYDTDGSITGTAGNYIGQFWWPWMQTGNTATSSSINFGAFDQGIMSVGGNVTVSAGGNIRDLSVSLPTTWRIVTDAAGKQTVDTIGGGNLRVSAGGDIFSGSYFVAKGSGSIIAGGSIGSDFNYAPINDLDNNGHQLSTSVSTLLALQDAQMTVSARGTVDIGGVYNPSYYADVRTTPVFSNPNGVPDSQSYGVNSSLTLRSTTGDVLFDTLSLPYPLFGYGGEVSPGDALSTQNGLGLILPANLNLTALQGGISVEGSGELYPSPTGNLNLLAADSIALYDNVVEQSSNHYLGLIDVSADALPTPLNPGTGGDQIQLNDSNTFGHHDATPLHDGDTQPVRIYSLNGNIVDGMLGTRGFYINQLTVTPGKPANIYAGGDIVNLLFIGQNLQASDITRIVAAGNVYDTPLANSNEFSQFGIYPTLSAYGNVPVLELGGPGYFDVEAGGNIGPLSNVSQEVAQGYNPGDNPTGIISVGNHFNPYLPRQSANVSVLFGVGPSFLNRGQGAPVLDDQAFIKQYLAPGAPGAADFSADGINFSNELLAFMQQYEASRSGKPVTLSAAQAWTDYQALAPEVQQVLVEQVFFQILKATGADYNEVNSAYYHQYARGYQAINALFPPADGYTANALTGGSNGATKQVSTGSLDLRGSTIQTQQGGSIYLFGPGGQALLGSALAPPVLLNGSGIVVAGPNDSGILTLEKGDINIFTDQSLLLAQSRIFTEQGGDMTIWSSNGDINAGKGVRTTSEIPPTQYLCDRDNFCVVDDKGQVSGAGIATLQTIAGAQPGNVYLVAPRGTVDAGAAGIRVSGNLIVAAQSVANAFNIDVKGKEIGVPTGLVNVSAINAATSAAAAAEQSADALANRQPAPAATTISVEVIGFGQPDAEQKKRMREGI